MNSWYLCEGWYCVVEVDLLHFTVDMVLFKSEHNFYYGHIMLQLAVLLDIFEFIFMFIKKIT